MNFRFFIILCLLGLAAAEYPAPGSAAYINDNNVLQYALSLELLEANFYQQGLLRFNETDFLSAGYGGHAYQFLQIIRDHEIAHAAALSQLLRDRQQTPGSACGYNFNYNSVQGFLATGLILEETGVSAYDGAITSITQTDLKVIAATVASVEGRHAAYLNQLNQKQPFYNATDTPLLKATILAAASQFLNGTCPSVANISAATLFNSSQVSPQNLIQTTNQSAQSFTNDNNVLQFALTLENLESSFFSAAVANISRASFEAATGSGFVYDLFVIIRDHEIAHAAALRASLTARNVTPVAPCGQYLFSFNDSAAGARQFIEDSYNLEIVGLEAFIGSSMLISDPGLLLFGATVVTVEARHVAFERSLLANLTGDFDQYIPFPNVTDTAGMPAMLLQMASAFVNLSSCPTFTLPVPADSFRSNSTGSSGTGIVTGSNSASNSNSDSNSGSNSGSISRSNTGSSLNFGSASYSDNDSSAGAIALSVTISAVTALLLM